MKILHWDEMFHPTFGYQINVLTKYQVLQGHDVTIFTTENIENHPTFSNFANKIDIEKEDKKFTEKYGVKIVRLPIYRVISGRAIYKPGFIKKIINQNPDILMCHTNDTLSGMWITLKHKKLNMPIVFDNHMLEMASKNPLNKLFRFFFRKIITPVIIENNFKVIKTQDDNYVNKHLGIPSFLTPFISFGTDTTIFQPDAINRKNFREKHNISEDDFVISYIGKLTEAKGSKVLGEAVKKKFSSNKKIKFIIVGNATTDYEVEAKEMLEKSENEILFFSTQKYTDLPKFYQASELCLFPKQSSLSFYDAQATGLPVVLEDNSLNITRLKFNNGLVFEANNPLDLRKKIIDIIEMQETDYKKMSKNAYYRTIKNYDYKKIAQEYTDLMITEYNTFHSSET